MPSLVPDVGSVAQPSLEESIRDKQALNAVQELAVRLRRQQLVGSEKVAEAVAKVMRLVVSSARFWQLDELVNMIRTTGRYLQTALPSEPLIGNITRRVLFLMREEAKALTALEKDACPFGMPKPHATVAQSLAALSLSPSASMHLPGPISSSATPLLARSFSISDLVQPSDSPQVMTPTTLPTAPILSVQSPAEAHMSDSSSDGEDTPPQTDNAYQLKPLLIQAIQDLIDELESVDASIAKEAKDHIHSGEVILTLGESSVVRSFLRAAAKHRKFITVVPESAPSFDGHAMARSLSRAGLSVLLIPDSNLYALMPRVSKVIVGARCVLANGGILASIGTKAAAMAAREHSTPFVTLAGVYRVSPDWAWTSPDQLRNGNQGPISEVVNHAASRKITEEADILNPLWDYVSPSEIDMIITNVGEHPPSYVYRLIQENYHDEDLNL
ncbi:GCD complex subunit gcd7 [Malassezia cuniculi]|uniref:Translation initiation factor eIF2B subunit beta n=1 Tax=Malassezia cuniculi TaxID=948313 RepID=A0AAF0EYB5_9BASI|nr:GCD complex subunit gcd7 [Malassezia cuniculi]